MLKDAGLHPLNSDTAISNLVWVQEGFTSVFIWNYTPSEVCFLHLPVCLGRGGGHSRSFWRVFCVHSFGNDHTHLEPLPKQICYLMSHCLWPFGCALSPINPVLSCSSQKGLLNATMPYQQHNIITFYLSLWKGRGVENPCPGGYGKLTLIHDLHPNHPSVFSLVQLVEVAIVPHAPFIFVSFLP